MAFDRASGVTLVAEFCTSTTSNDKREKRTRTHTIEILLKQVVLGTRREAAGEVDGIGVDKDHVASAVPVQVVLVWEILVCL